MNILHLDENHPYLLETLKQLGFQNTLNYSGSKEEILKICHQFHGIVIRSRFTLDASFLEACTSLKFIARVGAGLENIDVAYAKQKGVELIAAPEGNRNAVAEHTLGMLLSLFNNLNKGHQEIKQGHWFREANRGHEVNGKVIGIIGYGNMGKSFAKKLQGFSCKVLCYDIKENVGDNNAKQVSLDTFFKEVDVVSLHTPLTPQTQNLINNEFISKFKKPIWILNTARGKSLVTAHLVNALESGKVLGAGLDVLEYEKSSFESLFTQNELPEALKKLLEHPQVMLSPHVAGWTQESKLRLVEVIVSKIKALYL